MRGCGWGEPCAIQRKSRRAPAFSCSLPSLFDRAVRQGPVTDDPAVDPDIQGRASQAALADFLAPFELGADVALAGAGGCRPGVDIEITNCKAAGITRIHRDAGNYLTRIAVKREPIGANVGSKKIRSYQDWPGRRIGVRGDGDGIEQIIVGTVLQVEVKRLRIGSKRQGRGTPAKPRKVNGANTGSRPWVQSPAALQRCFRHGKGSSQDGAPRTTRYREHRDAIGIRGRGLGRYTKGRHIVAAHCCRWRLLSRFVNKISALAAKLAVASARLESAKANLRSFMKLL